MDVLKCYFFNEIIFWFVIFNVVWIFFCRVFLVIIWDKLILRLMMVWVIFGWILVSRYFVLISFIVFDVWIIWWVIIVLIIGILVILISMIWEWCLIMLLSKFFIICLVCLVLIVLISGIMVIFLNIGMSGVDNFCSVIFCRDIVFFYEIEYWLKIFVLIGLKKWLIC